MQTEKNAAYCSLGCKVNQYDTDAMRSIMEASGYKTVAFHDIADVYIINTCSVTHISDRKSRQMISRAHTRNPDAIIVVTGCYSKTAPDAVASLPGVNIVLGTNERSMIADIINDYVQKDRASVFAYQSDNSYFEDLSANESDKTRAYLKIQDGCNRFCSYCIIPYARGRIRSRSLESVKREFIKLAEHGYKEVVLTGIHLMSYGVDLCGIDIVDAIAQADDIQGIERIRLGSLEPEFVTDRFVNSVCANKKVCRQFHLSLQSGSDTVLKRMNRKYTSEQYAQAVEKLRTAMPKCAITTDIIAGFAGETEAEHEETLAFVKRIRFSSAHVFPYSVRKGTAAESMKPQVPSQVKERRAHELMQLAGNLHNEYIESFIGDTLEVLLEEPCSGGMRGYTDTYIDVHTVTDKDLINTICNVKITGVRDGHLFGELADTNANN